MGGTDMNIDPRLRGDDDDVTSDEERQLGYNPQAKDAEYDRELGHERKAKKQKLQQRFENIFEKYGRDFEGIGDEIDLKTGLIVVDNGHLKNMRHEADAGGDPWSGDVETSAENDDNLDEAGDSGSDGDSEGDFDEDGGLVQDEDDSTSGNTNGGWFSAREQSADSATSVSAPESGLFIGSKSGPSRVPRVTHDSRPRQATQPIESFLPGIEDAAATPDDILNQIPSLRASMLDIQMKQKSGQSMNQDAIHQLGMSIASQLANFVNNNDHQTPKPQRNQVRDSLWAYPALPEEHDDEPQHKRRRTRSPSPFPYYAGPSPGQKSLWAPISHPRPRKKYKRRNNGPEAQALDQEGSESLFITENGGSVPQPVSQNEGDAPRMCYNCQCTDSLIWRTGPDGILCNACGMYYYRYGLIRPLGPRSESEDSEMSEDSDPEIEGLAPDHSANIAAQIAKDTKNVRFKMHEDAMVIRLKEIDQLSWEKIAKHLPERTAYGVQCRYSKKLHGRPVEARAYLVNQGYDFRHNDSGVISFTPAPSAPKGWTEEEDDLLLKLREGDGLDWEKVADSFPGRTARAMEKRYKYLARKYMEGKSNKPKRKGKRRADPVNRLFMRYSEEEDELLLKLREVEKLSWIELAQRFPGRNAMALQKRYVRELAYKNKDKGIDPLAAESGIFLRSNPLKYSRYVAEEDEMLLRLRDDLGLDWKEIEAKMPGRKSQSLENRYQYLKTKDTRQQSQANGAPVAPNTEITTQPSPDVDFNGAQSDDELIQDTEESLFMPESSVLPTQIDHQQGVESSCTNDTDNGQKQMQTIGVDPSLTELDSGVAREQNTLNAHAHSTSNPMSSGANASALTGIASRRGLRWTKQESDMVSTLREEGVSFEEIGKRMPWRTPKAIKNFYTTTFGKKADRKTVPPPLKGEHSLLRQAVDNYMQRCSQPAGPPANTAGSLIDPTLEDSSFEASTNADDEPKVQNSRELPQAQGLVPSPLSLDADDGLLQDDVEQTNHSKPASNLHASPLPHVWTGSASPTCASKPQALSHDPTASSRDFMNTNYQQPFASSYPEMPYRLPEQSYRSSEPAGARTTANYFTPMWHGHQTQPYYIAPPTQLYTPSLYEQRPGAEPSADLDVVIHSDVSQSTHQAIAVSDNARPVTRSSTRSAAMKGQLPRWKTTQQRESDIQDFSVARNYPTVHDVQRILDEELINDGEPVYEPGLANEAEEIDTPHRFAVGERLAEDQSRVSDQQGVRRRKAGRKPRAPRCSSTERIDDKENTEPNSARPEESITDKDLAVSKTPSDDNEPHAAHEQAFIQEKQGAQRGQKRGRYGVVSSESINSPTDPPRKRGRPQKKTEETQTKPIARSPVRTRMTVRADAKKAAEQQSVASDGAGMQPVYDDWFSDAEAESLLPEASVIEVEILQPPDHQEMSATMPKSDVKQPSIREADSDISREPQSTSGMSNAEDDGIDDVDPLQSDVSEASNIRDSMMSSSSPILSMKTPGSVYRKTATPATDRSTLFERPQHRGVATLRSSFGASFARSRSSSVALPDSTKRVVYTPVRDVEGSEDELS